MLEASKDGVDKAVLGVLHELLKVAIEQHCSQQWLE